MTYKSMSRRAYVNLAVQSCLLLLLLALVLGYHQHDVYQRDRKVHDATTERNLALMAQRADGLLERLGLDADFIAHSPVLRMYLRNPSAETLAGAQDALLTLAALRPYLDQVRYIDENGVEQIRVDTRDGSARLAAELQDKSDRDYVQAGLALADGALYFSEINPNIERGLVERPYQPMMRVVAKAVVDGSSAGLVVLNARAQELGQSLQMVLGEDQQLVILNSAGGWITGGGEHDWQFAVEPNAPGASLAVQEPALWATIQAHPSGQFDYQGQCHDYRWYDFKLRQGSSPRWLIAQRSSTQPCGHLVSSAVNTWALQLALTSAFTFPLLWLWYFSRASARALQRGLRDSNTQLELVTQEADLGLVMVDRECRVRWINPEAERLLGWQAGALIGENLHERIHLTAQGESLHAGPCPTQQALASGQRFRKDRDRILNRTGDVLHVSLRVSPYGEGEERKAIVTMADVRDFVARERRLTLLATTDELTGALNRRSTLEHLKAFLDDPKIQPCVLMADIDFFKRVNDTYGHAAGDRVLKTFADTIRQLLRKGDLLGRMGGEEFLVALGHTDLQNAQALAERLRVAVAVSRALCNDGTHVSVTASFGLARYDGKETVDQLLARADEALYRAKHSGRNRVETS